MNSGREAPGELRLGKPVPQMPGEASEGCLAEAHRAKAEPVLRSLRELRPTKNIENNPMHSSGMDDR